MKQLTFDERDLKRIFISDTPTASAFRKFKYFLRQLIYLAIIYFIFYFAINYPAFALRTKYAIDPGAVAVATPSVAVPTPSAPLPNYSPEIEISKIGVTAPIILDVAPENIVDQLKNGVTQYQDTALPGQVGNVVIVGHSSDYSWSTGQYKTIFALLDKLAAGDIITIPFRDQTFQYQVDSTKIVKPTDLSVLRKSSTPTLTLISCYPVGSTRTRFIVSAHLIKGTTTGVQEKEPAALDNLPKIR